ncbi:MAG: hypothetical protein FWD61_02065 [Phycisphaerales bacterium]|nr:hypothetical protein [Phycisphaerales bacterium]
MPIQLGCVGEEAPVVGRYSILAMMALAGILAGSAVAAPRATNSRSARSSSSSPPPVAPARGNPLLPPPIAVEGFFPEMTLVQKRPMTPPPASAGFEALYTSEDWDAYKARFGAAAEELPRKRASGQIEFANTLIDAADVKLHPELSPGLRRLLLLRAAAISYRSAAGYPTANKAMSEYQQLMDLKSPAQVGALWTMANAMSRISVTPRADRIRYSGIAAQANMQFALLMLEADQIDAAQSMVKLLGYHEGWLKSNTYLRGLITQTRTIVRQSATMMDYLSTQYRPAIAGDDDALMRLYLYGRFVKNDPTLVADFPSRKPTSAMAQLADQLQTAERDVTANFAIAELLRTVAASLPDGMLKQRTLYAALERYRTFIRSPETQRERVKRTLALMAIEAAVSDGARPGVTIQPFASPPPPPASPSTTQPAILPAEEVHAVG